MKNNQNLAIVVLAITATILLAMLLGLRADAPAYAEASIKQGDYIMVNGAITQGTDFVYIIDIAARKLNVYALDRRAGKGIEIRDSVELERAFASAD